LRPNALRCAGGEPKNAAMLAAFLLVAAYLGFVAVGSPHMDPPPKPIGAATGAPAPAAPVSVASGRDEGAARPAER